MARERKTLVVCSLALSCALLRSPAPAMARSDKAHIIPFVRWPTFRRICAINICRSTNHRHKYLLQALAVPLQSALLTLPLVVIDLLVLQARFSALHLVTAHHPDLGLQA